MENAQKDLILIEYQDFCENMIPFGSYDLRIALDKLDTVKHGYGEFSRPCEILQDLSEEWQSSIGDYDLSKIDIVALVYEDILQKARGKIEELTKYDFQNDFKGSGGIYVAGNYCATSIDYSDESRAELEKKTKKHKKELAEDVFVSYLFDALDI